MTVAFSRDFVVGDPSALERLPTFGWHNLLLLGGLDASSVDGDHARELACDGYTSTAWRSNAGPGDHFIIVGTQGAAAADYAAVAAHTLANCVVRPEYFSGLDWVAAAPGVALTSNAPAVWTFPQTSAIQWRLHIQGAGGDVSIGALHIGLAMRPDTGLRAGWEPPSLNEDVEYSGPISVGGQILPRLARRRGVRAALSLPQLGYDFARAEWLTFLEHAHERAFFFWLLFGDHAEVVYGGLDDHDGQITRAKRTDLGLRMTGIAR